MANVEDINLSEQILFYNLKKPEKPVYKKELAISDRAVVIAKEVHDLRSEDSKRTEVSRKKLGEIFRENEMVKRLGLSTFGRLREMLSEEVMLAKLSNKDKQEANQLYFDVVDGFSLGTLWNVKKEDTKLQQAINTGEGEKVDDLYRVPNELKGVGEVVIDGTIIEPKLIDEIELLQINIEGGGASRVNFERTYERITEIYRTGNKEQRKQAKMVLAYLNSMIQGMVEAENRRRSPESAVVREIKGLRKDETLRAELSERQFKERDRLEQEEEKREALRDRLRFFRGMWWFINPEEVGLSETSMPGWMKERSENWVEKIKQLSRAAYSKVKYGDGDVKKLIDLGDRDTVVFTASNREMEMLVNQTRGVKESLELLVKTFFEPQMENGFYVLKLKNSGVHQRYYNDKDLLLSVLVNELTVNRRDLFGDSDDLKNETDAIEAAAVALNLLFVGNTWESAGKGKDTTFSKSAMTSLMFPDTVAKTSILGGGYFTGQLGEWVRNIQNLAISGNKSCQKFMESWSNGEIHLFPQRLFYSFVEGEEVMVIKADGTNEKMSMAKALYEGCKIDFENSGEQGWATDLWAGDYLGTGNVGLNLFGISTGAAPLKTAEMRLWGLNTARVIKKGRRKELVSPSLNKEYIRWALAASFEGDLVRLKTPATLLNIGSIGPDTVLDVTLEAMVKEGVITKKEKREIEDDFVARDGLKRFWIMNN